MADRKLTEAQRAYEAKRAAKAGMSLEKWLAEKEKRAAAEAKAAAEATKAPAEPKKPGSWGVCWKRRKSRSEMARAWRALQAPVNSPPEQYRS